MGAAEGGEGRERSPLGENNVDGGRRFYRTVPRQKLRRTALWRAGAPTWRYNEAGAPLLRHAIGRRRPQSGEICVP